MAVKNPKNIPQVLDELEPSTFPALSHEHHTMIIKELPQELPRGDIYGSKKGTDVMAVHEQSDKQPCHKRKLSELNPAFRGTEPTKGGQKEAHETKRLDEGSKEVVSGTLPPSINTQKEVTQYSYTMDSRVGNYYKMKILNHVTNLTHYELVTDNQLSKIIEGSTVYELMGGVVDVVGSVMKKKILLLEKTGTTPVVNPYFPSDVSEMSWLECGRLNINMNSSVSDIPEILNLTIAGFKKNDKHQLMLCFTVSVWEPVEKTLKKETYFTESSFVCLKNVHKKHRSKRLKKILTDYALASDARNKIYCKEYKTWWINPEYTDELLP